MSRWTLKLRYLTSARERKGKVGIHSRESKNQTAQLLPVPPRRE